MVFNKNHSKFQTLLPVTSILLALCFVLDFEEGRGKQRKPAAGHLAGCRGGEPSARQHLLGQTSWGKAPEECCSGCFQPGLACSYEGLVVLQPLQQEASSHIRSLIRAVNALPIWFWPAPLARLPNRRSISERMPRGDSGSQMHPTCSGLLWTQRRKRSGGGRVGETPEQAELVPRCPVGELASPSVSLAYNRRCTGKMFNSQPSENRTHLTSL